jgi:hypothetical protein
VRPVKELRVHLGAHKTATTHLQDTMYEHRDALAAAGIDYVPREDFGPLQRRYSNPSHWRMQLWSPPLELWFRRQFSRGRRGGETVLLSDEDLLGFSDDLLRLPIYATLRSAHILRALSRNTRLRLFLGIRSFDEILPSAYAQAIKSIAPKPGWLDEIRARMADTPPSWVELVDRLKHTFPDAAIHVWLHQDYRQHSQEILTFFAGRDVGRFPDIPPPIRTTSPSAEAIARSEGLDPALPVERRRELVKQIFYEEPSTRDGCSRFKPLSEHEIERFRSRFEQDRIELERRHPGTLLKLGES